MSTPHDDAPPGYVSVAILEESANLIAAQTITDLLTAVMENAPGVPEFESENDRQRAISWLEMLHQEHWARVNLITPSAPDSPDGIGDEGWTR
jgi:hypothetical protein